MGPLTACPLWPSGAGLAAGAGGAGSESDQTPDCLGGDLSCFLLGAEVLPGNAPWAASLRVLRPSPGSRGVAPEQVPGGTGPIPPYRCGKGRCCCGQDGGRANGGLGLPVPIRAPDSEGLSSGLLAVLGPDSHGALGSQSTSNFPKPRCLPCCEVSSLGLAPSRLEVSVGVGSSIPGQRCWGIDRHSRLCGLMFWESGCYCGDFELLGPPPGRDG